MITLEERYLGCLLGLACGDAVGTTLEFAAPGTFVPLTDMLGGGPFELEPGQWTDDTSMALCLAESLLEQQGFDAADQARRYLRWRDEGYLSATGECFDIGIATNNALERFANTGEPYAGSTHPNSAGNGSLMRLAPVPMRWRSDPQQTVDYAARSSRITHAAVEAVDACRYFAVLIAQALTGISKDELLDSAADFLQLFTAQPLAPAIAALAEGSYRHKQPPAIRGSGYVVHTLEAVLWALAETDDFRSGLLQVVNLGEDADTTGAVYGQIAGALYGVEAIPPNWRERIAMRDLIENYALGLLQRAE